MTFTAQLEARRVELGLSIDDLAERAGYGRHTIARTLHGGNVRVQTLVDVAFALGLILVVENVVMDHKQGCADHIPLRI